MVSTLDMMQRVVDRTSEVLVRQGVESNGVPIKGVSFYADQIRAVNQALNTRTVSGEGTVSKLPGVVMLLDFAEKHYNRGTHAYYWTARLQILLIAATFVNANPSAQVRGEAIYKPLLYPMRDAFLDAIDFVPGISRLQNSELVIIDRYRLSNSFNEAVKSQGIETIFNDALDGIEIRNLDVKISLSNCYNYGK